MLVNSVCVLTIKKEKEKLYLPTYALVCITTARVWAHGSHTNIAKQQELRIMLGPTAVRIANNVERISSTAFEIRGGTWWGATCGVALALEA